MLGLLHGIQRPRAGNLARPFFPDGDIFSGLAGPLKPATWSFSVTNWLLDFSTAEATKKLLICATLSWDSRSFSECTLAVTLGLDYVLLQGASIG
ncbi:MAG: hypothetical protein ACREYF_23920 [Gammaproteobacteria bacterium]